MHTNEGQLLPVKINMFVRQFFSVEEGKEEKVSPLTLL